MDTGQIARGYRWIRLLPRNWDGPTCYIFEIFDNEKLVAQSFPVCHLEDVDEVEALLCAALTQGAVEQESVVARTAVRGGVRIPWFSSALGFNAKHAPTRLASPAYNYFWIRDILRDAKRD